MVMGRLCTIIVLFFLVVSCVLSNHGAFAAASGMMELMDASTGKLQSIPGQATDITTVITSPGTPSTVLLSSDDDLLSSSISSNVLLAARPSDDDSTLLVCRGATLTTDTNTDVDSNVGRCLTVCGAVSDCLVLDGVTAGDVEAAGLRHSRHARTLSALFRSRMLMTLSESDDGDGDDSSSGRTAKQTLILAVSGGSVDETASSALEQDVEALFKAIAVEKKGKQPAGSFSDLYDLRIVSVDDESSQVRFAVYLDCLLCPIFVFGIGDLP